MSISVTPIPITSLSHSELTGVTTSQHHTLYTNAEALAAAIAGLGSAAVLDAGVGNLNLPQMNSTGYPVADGSQITNITLKAKMLTGSRTSGAGTGSQAVTGAGFAPTSLIMWACEESTDKASWGFGDMDAVGEALRRNPTVYQFMGLDRIVGISDGVSDQMDATLTSLDADGFTLAWIKSGSGLTVNWAALCLR